MSEPFPADLLERLRAFDQTHVLRGWDGLAPVEQHRLIAQLHGIDFDQIRALWRQASGGKLGTEAEDPRDRARRAAPPSDIVALPAEGESRRPWSEAAALGDELLRAGRVGVVIVAGGEGTRLQFPYPKGMYPIGPVTGRTLFQWLAEQIRARSRAAGAALPCYIMTSEATHDDTVAHFAEQRWFDLPHGDVRFFRQGTMPVVGIDDGRLLLAARGDIAMAPDGHGGLVAALERDGLVDDMRRRGLQHIFYMQIDNPTVLVCDPAFLGFHAARGSELSTKVVAKTSAAEKMGVLCDVDGRTEIIEYSDMPAEVAAQTDAAGRLVHWAGNTAIHIFSVDLLSRLADGREPLPFHIARKHVPFIDESGALWEPVAGKDPPNGCKFEKFIFDALPRARKTLVVEADRGREFNPLKDRTGDNSPEAVRKALTRIFRGWLDRAGVATTGISAVEISPLAALDETALAALDADALAQRTRRVPVEGGVGVVIE